MAHFDAFWSTFYTNCNKLNCHCDHDINSNILKLLMLNSAVKRYRARNFCGLFWGGVNLRTPPLNTGLCTLTHISHRFSVQSINQTIKSIKINFIAKLEIRSMERGICPIATLALHLTLYSLTGSRFDP